MQKTLRLERSAAHMLPASRQSHSCTLTTEILGPATHQRVSDALAGNSKDNLAAIHSSRGKMIQLGYILAALGCRQ